MDQATQLRRLVLRSGRAVGGDAAVPPRMLVVSSGKAAVGSTTAAVNLAAALAGHGARTVLVDADLARADVATQCGLSESIGIADVLLGRKDIHEALQRGPGGMQVVVGASTSQARNACTERALQRMQRQIQSLGRHADLVLIDVGAGSGAAALHFWQAADEVLLVTTPDAVAVMDTYATVKTRLGRPPAARPLRLVVNGAHSADVAADVHRRIDQSCQRFLSLRVPLAGWIPPDELAPADQRRGQPPVIARPDSPLAAAIEQLAEQVLADSCTPRQPRQAA